MTTDAEAPETVLGLDNVPLALPVAAVGTRALAAFVDYLLVTLLLAGWTVAVFALVVTVGRERAWIPIVLMILGWFALEYGYFAGLELLMNGQTPGKRALGLRVVDAAGGRAETRAILVRNCVRSVDLVLGVPLMAMDSSSRRLGDRLGGTLVVHEAAEERAPLVRRVPRGWQARDVAVVESFFRRREHLDPHRRAQLASRLLEAVRRDDPDLVAGLPPGSGAEDALRQALDVEDA